MRAGTEEGQQLPEMPSQSEGEGEVPWLFSSSCSPNSHQGLPLAKPKWKQADMGPENVSLEGSGPLNTEPRKRPGSQVTQTQNQHICMTMSPMLRGKVRSTSPREPLRATYFSLITEGSVFRSLPCRQVKRSGSATFSYTHPEKFNFSPLSSSMWKKKKIDFATVIKKNFIPSNRLIYFFSQVTWAIWFFRFPLFAQATGKLKVTAHA